MLIKLILSFFPRRLDIVYYNNTIYTINGIAIKTAEFIKNLGVKEKTH